MRCTTSTGDRGSVTAEFAVILPAAILLVVFLVSAVAQQVTVAQGQRRLELWARALEAGKTQEQVLAEAKRGNLQIHFQTDGDYLCLSGVVTLRLIGLHVPQELGQVCALQPGI